MYNYFLLMYNYFFFYGVFSLLFLKNNEFVLTMGNGCLGGVDLHYECIKLKTPN